MAIDQCDVVADPCEVQKLPSRRSRSGDPVTRWTGALTTAAVWASVSSVVVLGAMRLMFGKDVGPAAAVVAGVVVLLVTGACSWLAQPMVSRLMVRLTHGPREVD